MKELFISKILSGRFIFTIICACVFAYVSVKRIIPAEAVVSIIVSVVTAYFGRPDRAPEKSGGTGTGT